MLAYLTIIFLFGVNNAIECYYSTDLESISSSLSSSSEDEKQTTECNSDINYCIIKTDGRDFDDILFQGCDTPQICQSIGNNSCGYLEITPGEKELICCCNEDLCNNEDQIENFESFPFKFIFSLIKGIFYIIFYFVMCFLFYKLLKKKVKIIKSDIKPCYAFIPFYNQYLWIVKVAELAPEWFCISLVGLFGGCWICIEPYISIKAGKKFGKSGCWSCIFLFFCRLCGLFSLAFDDTIQYTSDIELRVRDNNNNNNDNNNDNNDIEGDKVTYVANEVDMSSLQQINQPQYIPPALETSQNNSQNVEKQPLITTNSV